ncbi:MAG: hypothetical protein AAFO87_08480 [Cyanobacteria bacterium J06607_6]
MPLSIAPEVLILSASRQDDEVIVSVTIRPAILLELVSSSASSDPLTIPLEQRVFLSLFEAENRLPTGDSQIPAEPFTLDASLPPGTPLPEVTDRLSFRLGVIEADTYQVRPRLRVDGVDSLIIQDYTLRPPRFLDYQDLIIP